MIDQRALHFHRSQPVARHIQHVVHAAKQPVETIVVETRAVAGEVGAVGPAAPILLNVTIGIAINAAEHRRPWLRQGKKATALLDSPPLSVADLGNDSWKRPSR